MITADKLTQEYNEWVKEYGMDPAPSGLRFGRMIADKYNVQGGNSTEFEDPFEAMVEIITHAKGIVFPPGTPGVS